MHFSSICTVAFSLLSSFASALQNPIVVPAAGVNVQAGSSLEIKWDPTTNGWVNLVLRYGPTQNLYTGNPVASKIANTGSFTWVVPNNIGNGQWSIAITTGNDADTNYSPMFTISGGTGNQGAVGSASKVTATTAFAATTIQVTATVSDKLVTRTIVAAATGSAAQNEAVPVRAGSFAAAVGLGALVALA